MMSSLRPRVWIAQGDGVEGLGRTKIFNEVGGLQPQDFQIPQLPTHSLFGDLGGPTEQSFHGNEIPLRFSSSASFRIDSIPRPQIDFHGCDSAKDLRPHIGREKTGTGEPRIRRGIQNRLSGAFCHRGGRPTYRWNGLSPWRRDRCACSCQSCVRSAWASRKIPHRPRRGTSP